MDSLNSEGEEGKEVDDVVLFVIESLKVET